MLLSLESQTSFTVLRLKIRILFFNNTSARIQQSATAITDGTISETAIVVPLDKLFDFTVSGINVLLNKLGLI